MFFLKEGENLMIVLQQRFDWKTILFGATEVHTCMAHVKYRIFATMKATCPDGKSSQKTLRQLFKQGLTSG